MGEWMWHALLCDIQQILSALWKQPGFESSFQIMTWVSLTVERENSYFNEIQNPMLYLKTLPNEMQCKQR